MKRRDFLNIGSKVILLGSIPKIVLANNDYSNMDNTNNAKKYTYDNNPIIYKENNIIQSNILPNNFNIDFWNKPRSLFIKVTDTSEVSHIVYFENGKINENGYRLACYLLRDTHTNEIKLIDLKLLDLICAVQAWIKHYGYNDPILINSAYRSLKTNNKLEGASKNSMHLSGRAVDFTVPGLSPLDLGRISAKFNAGGIGLYPIRNFIHLDTGNVRYWLNK